MQYEASFFKNKDNKIECSLCPHNCIIAPNKFVSVPISRFNVVL